MRPSLRKLRQTKRFARRSLRSLKAASAATQLPQGTPLHPVRRHYRSAQSASGSTGFSVHATRATVRRTYREGRALPDTPSLRESLSYSRGAQSKPQGIPPPAPPRATRARSGLRPRDRAVCPAPERGRGYAPPIASHPKPKRVWGFGRRFRALTVFFRSDPSRCDSPPPSALQGEKTQNVSHLVGPKADQVDT